MTHMVTCQSIKQMPFSGIRQTSSLVPKLAPSVFICNKLLQLDTKNKIMYSISNGNF